MDEATIIERARQGEEAGWEALVRENQEAVFRLAYLITGDAAAADDVAQETFLRALRGLKRFEDGRPVRPWLLRIASRLAYNRQRSVGRYLAAVQRWAQGRLGETIEGLESKAVERLQAKQLHEAVQQLRRKEQEVIYLRYFINLSNEETAQAMGVAAGTVKSRLHRSLRRLKDLIQRDHPELSEE